MKVLVIGYGSIGRRHAQLLAAQVEVAVVEVDDARRATAANEGARAVFADIDSALRWQPEAIVIATPTHLHAPCCRAVLASGARILIEKPIAHSPEDLDWFSGLAPEDAARIKVMANMRFHAGPDSLRAHLAMVGKPLIASAHFGSYLPEMRPGVDYRSVYAAHRAQGGGVLLDCIHELDYLTWLFGMPRLVDGRLGRLSTLDIDVEDHAVMILDHPGGVRSVVEMDYLQRYKFRSCRITGEQGTLVWQSRTKAPEIIDVSFFAPDERAPRVLYADPEYYPNDIYSKYLQAFVEFCRGADSGRLLDATTAIAETRLLLSVIGKSEL